MKCLPDDYVPLCGSEGEKRRKEMYAKQLPPHDLDPDLCHAMTDVERKRLTKLADKIKVRACGAGTVNLSSTKEPPKVIIINNN